MHEQDNQGTQGHMGGPRGELRVQALDDGFIVSTMEFLPSPDGRSVIRRERNLARVDTASVRSDLAAWLAPFSDLVLPEDAGNITKFPTS